MNEQKRFHPCLNEPSEAHLTNSLSSASNTAYGSLDHLSEMLSWIKDAIILRNREGLSIFLFETRAAANKLSESNKKDNNG